MARIRTVKPEFWEDEVVGLLSREARLLFIATFNLADDEGLLRWSAPYIKATVFMYDDDLSVGDVTGFMAEITAAGLLFAYIGGIARQQLAVVVNFRKHQKINRPQPGKLPPPSLQSYTVREMYARRDGWTCQLCKRGIPEKPVDNDSWNLSIDHIAHVSGGGSDYPSNVRAAHQACNKSRRDRSDDEFQAPASMRGGSVEEPVAVGAGPAHAQIGSDSRNGSVNQAPTSIVAQGDGLANDGPSSHTRSEIRSLNDSVIHVVSDSLPHSVAEGKGREGNREGKGTKDGGLAASDDELPLGMVEVAETAAPPGAQKKIRKKAEPKENPHQLADDLTVAFWERYKTTTAQSFIAVRQILRGAIGNGMDRDDLARAIDLLGKEGRAISGGTITTALGQIRAPRLRAVPGGYTPWTNPTDQNEYDGAL